MAESSIEQHSSRSGIFGDSKSLDKHASDGVTEHFNNAAEFLKLKVGELNNETLLYFYARYKQALVGSCNVPKPGFFDFQGKQKWSSWSNLKDMPKEEAMEQYVNKMNELYPTWAKEMEKPTMKKNKSSTMGPVVSTLSNMSKEEELCDNEKTAFDWVKEGNVKQLNASLDASGFSINQKDDQGLTLLHWACDRGHLNVVQALINKGININLQDNEGQTPLHYASSCGHENIVKELLLHNANSDIINSDDQNPKDVALNKTTADIFPS